MALTNVAVNEMLEAEDSNVATNHSFDALIGYLNAIRAPGSYESLSPGTANSTTSSATFVDLLSITTLIPTTGVYRLTFVGRCTSANARFTFEIPSGIITDSGSSSGDGCGAPIGSNVKFSRYVTLSQGFRTCAIQWRSTSGTITMEHPSLAQFRIELMYE